MLINIYALYEFLFNRKNYILYYTTSLFPWIFPFLTYFIRDASALLLSSCRSFFLSLSPHIEKEGKRGGKRRKREREREGRDINQIRFCLYQHICQISIIFLLYCANSSCYYTLFLQLDTYSKVF